MDCPPLDKSGSFEVLMPFTKMIPIVEILLCLQLALAVKAENSEQYFITEPDNVTLQSGESLELPCVVGNRQGACQWTKDGLGMGINPSLPGFPRFSMGEGATECFLIINPVQLEDEGLYQCQVGAVAGMSAIASSPVVISVSVEPGLPYILQAVHFDVKEVLQGQQVVLDCESQKVKPPARIKWFDGDKHLDSSNIKEVVTKQGDNKTFKTHSTLTLMPKENMNIKCSSFSEQFPSVKFSRVLQIKLRYAPKINIELSKDKIQEGDTFSITCNSKAYPENVTYKWFLGGKEIVEEKNNNLKIKDISREQHGAEVNCVVENEVGQTNVTKTLNVQFPPTILTHPQSMTAKQGDNVTLRCVAEGNPEPVYIWTKEGNTEPIFIWTKEKSNILTRYRKHVRFKVGHFNEGSENKSDLMIVDLENNDFGNYECLAANAVGKDDLTVMLVKESDDINMMIYVIGISIAVVLVIVLLAVLCWWIRKAQWDSSKDTGCSVPATPDILASPNSPELLQLAPLPSSPLSSIKKHCRKRRRIQKV